MKISIETTINKSIELVWGSWTNPKDIVNWNFASEDWCCPEADVELEVGKNFNYRMEAKDGSFGFNFIGTFTKIVLDKSIEFKMEDGRKVSIDFVPLDHGVRVLESFDAENEHSAEEQKQGWQSILDNFKNYVETKKS